MAMYTKTYTVVQALCAQAGSGDNIKFEEGDVLLLDETPSSSNWVASSAMSGTVSPTRVDVVIQGQGPSWEFVEGAILEDEAEEVVLPQSQRPEPKPYLLPIGAGISLLKFTPEQPGDLGLSPGEVVAITHAEPGCSWWFGFTSKGRGVFPCECVEPIEPSPLQPVKKLTHEGWLVKKGKQRWCTLSEDGVLYYYKSQDTNQKPRGMITITDFEFNPITSDPKKRGYAFEVSNAPMPSTVFFAQDEEEMTVWITALRRNQRFQKHLIEDKNRAVELAIESGTDPRGLGPIQMESFLFGGANKSRWWCNIEDTSILMYKVQNSPHARGRVPLCKANEVEGFEEAGKKLKGTEEDDAYGFNIFNKETEKTTSFIAVNQGDRDQWVFQLQKLIKRIRQPLRVPMTRLQKPTPEQAAAKSSSLPVASQLLNAHRALQAEQAEKEAEKEKAVQGSPESDYNGSPVVASPVIADQDDSDDDSASEAEAGEDACTVTDMPLEWLAVAPRGLFNVKQILAILPVLPKLTVSEVASFPPPLRAAYLSLRQAEENLGDKAPANRITRRFPVVGPKATPNKPFGDEVVPGIKPTDIPKPKILKRRPSKDQTQEISATSVAPPRGGKAADRRAHV
eukprot:TRINITY_DN4199_c0_g1_i1.p1 TRINITY_DN4199_c0_g1~~TRINITY_DN4199_c0_g1_i1.p1  ORF type:complete len:623 (+),score=119.12 TRINITY_DN4199_c0_g1_i1:76-1944(+)